MQMMPILESGEETLVGGQAVMEGVMMRAPHSYCVAVRKPSGEIVTEEMPLARMSEKHKIFRYPVFRGVGTLYQAMKLGGRALQFSATAALDDPEAEPQEKPLQRRSRAGPWPARFCFLRGVLHFHVQVRAALPGQPSWPTFIRCWTGRLAFNVADGVIRLAILLAFLYVLSRMKDIRRVFEYHGAEHKVVFNFESGKPVTVENAQRFITFHPRCGTSFLLVVFLLAIPVYALIPFDGFAAKFVCAHGADAGDHRRGYEMIRFAAKRRGSFLATLTAPGLWLQRITTKPPTDDQAAVAIHALEGAMELEESQGGELVIA